MPNFGAMRDSKRLRRAKSVFVEGYGIARIAHGQK
jgi:hypothetical protein